ncbi:MAG: hypothetical protein FJ349_09630, partial [Sphingomonadales bacterium]|nr:hypothetical protein [Sphingomonadales bacterium]
FTIAQSQTKKSKRTTKPKHEDRHEMTANKHDRKEGRSANSRLSQWGLTWLNQVQCFYQHLCLVYSDVLRNPPLRQAAKRYDSL